ncbi:MAG: LacI family DNA-binding transcriptional regulator [Treponema sp.]|jgi:LacI family transcriptional regulator|nr:LacI family DNA-binding transcriptional regulator [Treponema sp.]
MPPRIVDIAKAAGVSPSAVSLALNNKDGVSADLRKKIAGIAVNMGYRARFIENDFVNENITIKLLKIARHGHIINERHNAFITEYMEGIETCAKKRKYKLEVSFFNRAPIEEIINTEKNAAVDGFIVLGTELNAHELSLFAELAKPTVFIDTYPPCLMFDCIDMDNADGTFKVVQHLYNNGHRSIGLVKSSYEARNFKMREAGFLEAMGYFSLPVQEKYIINVDPAFDKAILDMNNYLDACEKLPSAFFCLNDIIAYGCMKALRDHKYRIPEDISIIGFDDLPSSSLSNPPLNTVQVSTHQIGWRALEKLAEQIISPQGHIPENILVAGNLVVRNSVRRI